MPEGSNPACPKGSNTRAFSNRFQMGWQIGVGFEYQKYYLGVQYGTDFIPAYSHKFEYDGATSKPKVNSQALKISLGYTF